MQVEQKLILIRDLVKDYTDDIDLGVKAYNGNLDVRPSYQREFIYSPEQSEEVIKTIVKGFPLNIMYWSKREDGSFEVIDGQQRTISICRYIKGDFSVKFEKDSLPLAYHNLTPDIKQKILNYALIVYECSGSDSDKLEWFQTINVAGEKLTKQELRNAVYNGTWITCAKKYFSKRGNPVNAEYGSYMSGKSERQELLETALKWIAHRDKVTLEQYMANHQYDTNANELWEYVQAVFAWVKKLFINQSKDRMMLMKGIDWGMLYNNFHELEYNSQELEQSICKLLVDDEVTNKKGIYCYLVTGQEKHLALRSFDDKSKIKMHHNQEGVCPKCNNYFDLSKMDAVHIQPWSQGGKTTIENGELICKACYKTIVTESN